MTQSIPHRRTAALVILAAGLPCALTLPAIAAPKDDAQARQAWQAAIARTPAPQDGCFKAAFPSTEWTQVACTKAPNRPYLPSNGHRGFTVGNGNDYSAVVTGIVSQTVGSFPSVVGVKKETGYGNQPNAYSLQINSQFFQTATCNGAANPSACLGWQQFVYSTSGATFMQYWLINYAATCPAGGWMAYGSDCYRNSSAVSTPDLPISELGSLTMLGTAKAGGRDTVVFTTPASAYSASGKDTVVNLAKSWNASEFNIIGDGGGSQAKFNLGSKITVGIALTDGLTAAPVCQPNDGTTGETNNLNLGSCTVAGGSTPSVTFLESR